MPAYMVVLGNNPSQGWSAEYVGNVPAILRRFGGEYIAVAKRVKIFEGSNMDPNVAALFSFPTLEKVNEFMASAEYAPFAALRKHNMYSLVFGFDTEA